MRAAGYNGETGGEHPFPLSVAYRALLPRYTDRVSEPRQRAFLYSERHLLCVWFDEHWRPPLRAHNAQEVRVVSPGRWNLEAGPDFLGAVLEVGPERRRLAGDVEIHVTPNDWQRHGHGSDRRYDGVVAHVTYRAGTLPTGALPPGTLQIAMQDAIAANPAFSFETIDLNAYPYATLASPAPCARVLLERSPDDQLALLNMAGQERLRLKAECIMNRIQERGSTQALYEELMGALGYKHNRTPFRELAVRVTARELAEESEGDPHRAYALLLGVAGLLPSDMSPHWDDRARDFVRRLWDCWWHLRDRWQSRVMPADSWYSANQRPTNQPTRRMAAAAGLGIGLKQTEDWLDRPVKEPHEWHAEARDRISARCPMGFWSRRLSLNGAPHASDVALIGAGRAAAITSNVFVPFVAAMGHDIGPLLDGMPSEEDNVIIRETAAALLGRDHNPSLYRHGLAQQGLIQIHRDFCLNSQTGCSRCPLPDALRAGGFEAG